MYAEMYTETDNMCRLDNNWFSEGHLPRGNSKILVLKDYLLGYNSWRAEYVLQ